MLGYNCDKTVITPPTTTASNKWTTQIDDNNNKVISMASSGGGKVMEKPGQELVQQQQVALRCPRCDSSNTKFCYYNNYSLSQPRHFCKACKRYWTRGGTLRNVPVGGGCRKNKRTSVKRPTTTSSSNNIIDTTTTTTSASVSAAASPSSTTPNSQPHIDNHHHPLLYGLPGGGGDVMNLLPFPRFNSRVSSSSYDLDQPQLNALGLGFSSGRLSSHEVNDDDGYRNGLFSSNNYNTLLSSYGSIFGSSNNSTTSSMPSTPVMASLLSSTLLQQKLNSGNSPFQGMNMNPLLQELKMEGNGSSGGSVAGLVQASKEVMKGEGQNNRLEWNDNNNGGVCQNQMEQHMGLSDPSSLYWNSNTATATALGAAWSEQPNIGPNSVTLL